MFGATIYREVIIAHDLIEVDAVKRAMQVAYCKDKRFSSAIHENEGSYLVEIKHTLGRNSTKFMTSLHDQGYNLKQVSLTGIICEVIDF